MSRIAGAKKFEFWDNFWLETDEKSALYWAGQIKDKTKELVSRCRCIRLGRVENIEDLETYDDAYAIDTAWMKL